MNKQTSTELSVYGKYEIPGILSFDETEHGLIRGTVTTVACTAEFYLQGAHLTQWQPKGQQPVLFLSGRAAIKPGAAIRGGVPVIFPWFGGRTPTSFSPRTDGPSHGFARTANWQLTSATMDGDDLHISLSLEASDISRSLGYDYFRLTYKLTIGNKLGLQLTVENLSKGPMQFEEALHSYFMIDEVQKSGICGLADTEYLDKTDCLKRKRQDESVLHLISETDRPYLNTEGEVRLNDPIFMRTIRIEKQNSKTTVIWNPWSEQCAKLADMTSDGWLHMVCIETANAMENAVILGPSEQHTMGALITVNELEA